MPGVIERDPYEGWTVTSFKQPAARNGFGVKVDAPIDLNDLSEPDFKKLEYLVYKHRVVVLKGQKQLRPAKQQELGYRLDPKVCAHLPWSCRWTDESRNTVACFPSAWRRCQKEANCSRLRR